MAETLDGQFWAIQAKAYDQMHWVTKADVDTFLSESGRPQFSFRLLVATTNPLGPTARRTLDQQEKPVGLVLLADLEKAEVAWPASPDDLRPTKLPPKPPLPHQREAIDAVAAGLAVRVVTDLVAGVAPVSSEAALAEMSEAGATLVTRSDLGVES